jgi:hypothetical protein
LGLLCATALRRVVVLNRTEHGAEGKFVRLRQGAEVLASAATATATTATTAIGDVTERVKPASVLIIRDKTVIADVGRVGRVGVVVVNALILLGRLRVATTATTTTFITRRP